MPRGESLFERNVAKAFRERQRTIEGIARRAGNSDVEDVVQESFLKLLEASQRQEVRTVDNLLARIVRCTAIDRLRARAKRLFAAAGEIGEGPVDLAADPERGLMGSQRLSRVLAEIEIMPPRRREVFLLHRIEELTYPQIAKRIGVSVKAVEKHMSLAMRQLSDVDD